MCAVCELKHKSLNVLLTIQEELYHSLLVGEIYNFQIQEYL